MAKSSKALAQEFNLFNVVCENSKLSHYFSEDQKVFQLQKSTIFSILFHAKKLANLIDENHIDILHFHWTKDLPLVVLAKLFSVSRPKVVQTRHMMMTRFKSDFYHKFLYKNLDLMIAVTDQVKEQLERFIPDEVRPKVQRVYLGVEKSLPSDISVVAAFQKELGMSDDSFNVGMIGRISKAKGQHLLIEALSKLQNKNIRLYFAGSEMQQGYIEALKTMASELNVSEQVLFVGFIKNPQIFYESCDAIVLASKNETFGLVVIEAMTAGTPVIASASGGVLEIIEDEVDGLLFTSENALELSKKIECLVVNPALRSELCAKAEVKVREQFDADKQFEKLKDLFNKDEF